PLRGGGHRRRHAVAAVPQHHAADAHADHRGRHDLLGAVHVHRLPAHLRAYPRRTAERHAPDGHAVVPARHFRRRAGRRCGARNLDGALPAGRHPVQLLRASAAGLAARGRPMSTQDKNEAVGMDYLQSMPRRWVTDYTPLRLFVFVLLFPFYWMAMTSVKPNEELLSRDGNPFWLASITFDHFRKLLFDTPYPEWLLNTMIVSVVSTFFSLFASVLGAYAIERLRFQGAKPAGLAIFFAYLVPPSILFIPLAAIVFNLGLFDTRWALILTYPTFLIPF